MKAENLLKLFDMTSEAAARCARELDDQAGALSQSIRVGFARMGGTEEQSARRRVRWLMAIAKVLRIAAEGNPIMPEWKHDQFATIDELETRLGDLSEIEAEFQAFMVEARNDRNMLRSLQAERKRVEIYAKDYLVAYLEAFGEQFDDDGLIDWENTWRDDERMKAIRDHAESWAKSHTIHWWCNARPLMAVKRKMGLPAATEPLEMPIQGEPFGRGDRAIVGGGSELDEGGAERIGEVDQIVSDSPKGDVLVRS